MSNLQQMSNRTKTVSQYDTIIIGSGMGGLGAAICLSRAGQRVLVLEQHDVPGGWCHSFYLNGHRFTPGVHYVGSVDGGSTSELYEGLGIANDLVFFRMNPKGYEHCWIGDERVDLPASFDELVNFSISAIPQGKTRDQKIPDHSTKCQPTTPTHPHVEWVLGSHHHSLAYPPYGEIWII